MVDLVLQDVASTMCQDPRPLERDHKLELEWEWGPVALI